MATHTLGGLDLMDHTKYYAVGGSGSFTPEWSPFIVVPINGTSNSRRTRPARIRQIPVSLQITCMGSSYLEARENANNLLDVIIDINIADVGTYTYVEGFQNESTRTYTPLTATYKEVERDLSGASVIVVDVELTLNGTWT